MNCPKSIIWPALPLLILIYIAAAVVVNPFGDFPLNDDWSYAAAARSLALAHDWRPTWWTSMPLITQSLWAAPFCVATNCSFDVLRASTLLSGLLLLVSSYYLFATVTKSAFSASLCTATVVFNPAIFALSYTFMADPLFVALMVTSSVFFIKTFHQDSSYLFVLACILAVAATLCRQVGLCVPLAYMIVNILRADTPPQRILRSAAPVVLCVAALMLFELWMQRTGRLPSLYYVKSGDLIDHIRHPVSLIPKMVGFLAASLLYLGLFSLPVLLLVGRTAADSGASRAFQWAPTALASVATLVAVALLYMIGSSTGRLRLPAASAPEGVAAYLMPIGGNIIIRQGLGPLTLYDASRIGLNHVPALPVVFWTIITGLSLWGLFRLTQLIAQFCRELMIDLYNRRLASRNPERLFGFMCAAIYLAPLVVAGFYDRYIAAIVPLVILFIIASENPRQRYAAPAKFTSSVSCAAFAIYATLGTHDYMSWNRARWQAIADLERSDKTTPNDIDGGFEHNGSATIGAENRTVPGLSPWRAKNDIYRVTFGRIPGLKIVRRYEYPTYLPHGKRFIYVLRH